MLSFPKVFDPSYLFYLFAYLWCISQAQYFAQDTLDYCLGIWKSCHLATLSEGKDVPRATKPQRLK